MRVENGIGLTGLYMCDNVVRWIEGSETSRWFWLLSGKGEALIVFGALSALDKAWAGVERLELTPLDLGQPSE